MTGAISYVTTGDAFDVYRGKMEVIQTIEFFRKKAGVRSVMEWNDRSDTTKAVVIKALREAGETA